MFIIDGHNLIPKIPGMSLRDIDDEEKLIGLLKEYARLKRKTVIVFFDGAPPGQAVERAYGLLRAYFVPAGRTADDAIRQYLDGMGKTARTATVVSSDRQVRANARELRARVLSSEDFASQLIELRSWLDARSTNPASAAQKPPRTEARSQSGSDISEWIEVFGLDPTRAEEPIELSKKPPRKPKVGKPKPTQPPQGKAPVEKKPRRHHGFPRKP
jgi:predicted RNA-binding protein with PIN domain